MNIGAQCRGARSARTKWSALTTRSARTVQVGSTAALNMSTEHKFGAALVWVAQILRRAEVPRAWTSKLCFIIIQAIPGTSATCTVQSKTWEPRFKRQLSGRDLVQRLYFEENPTVMEPQYFKRRFYCLHLTVCSENYAKEFEGIESRYVSPLDATFWMLEAHQAFWGGKCARISTSVGFSY